MSSNTWFCTLPYFDFNSGAGFQIIRMDAKTAGSYLYNGIFSITVKIFMQTALSGVI